LENDLLTFIEATVHYPKRPTRDRVKWCKHGAIHSEFEELIPGSLPDMRKVGQLQDTEGILDFLKQLQIQNINHSHIIYI